MSIGEVLFVVIRWMHSIAAVAWVGGGIFYLFILKPSIEKSESSKNYAIGQDFRALVVTAMGILIITGAILTFDRLTSGFVGVPYIVVLSIKVFTAFYMFYLVRFLRTEMYTGKPDHVEPGYRRWTSWVSSATSVVILGVIVFLLADVLSALFENGLRG